MIVSCTCNSEFQDAEHGIGRRVATPSPADTGGNRKAHCTICGREHQAGKVEVKAKKGKGTAK